MTPRPLFATFLTALVVSASTPARAAELPLPAQSATEPAPRAWRGTTLVYDNALSAPSLVKSADLTWNPYYVQSLSFRPEWHFGETAAVRARFDMEKELTNSDDTTRYHELILGDVSLEGTGQLFEERRTGIKLTGTLRAIGPLSKASQAQTLVVGFQSALGASRKFDVLSGLSVSYALGGGMNVHRYTTAQYDAPTIACQLADECARFVNTGLRNSHFSLNNGPTVALAVTPKLSITSVFLFRKSFLYALTPTSVSAATGAVSPDPSNDVSVRSGQRFLVDLSYQVNDQLGVSFGMLSDYADLAPDGTLRTPFANRLTSFYFDLSVDLESAARRF